MILIGPPPGALARVDARVVAFRQGSMLSRAEVDGGLQGRLDRGLRRRRLS